LNGVGPALSGGVGLPLTCGVGGLKVLRSFEPTALQTVVSLSASDFVFAGGREDARPYESGLVGIGNDDHPVEALEHLVRGRMVVRVVPEDPGAASL
jgi:hypothetical protein